WFFGDAFLGTVNADHSRPKSAPLVHNAIVVQQGNSLVQTITGGTAAAPTSLIGSDTDSSPGDLGWWPTDPQVVGNTLQVFYTHVKSGGTALLNYVRDEVGVATFALPSLTVQSFVKVPALSSASTWWAEGLVDGQDGYT